MGSKAANIKPITESLVLKLLCTSCKTPDCGDTRLSSSTSSCYAPVVISESVVVLNEVVVVTCVAVRRASFAIGVLSWRVELRMADNEK